MWIFFFEFFLFPAALTLALNLQEKKDSISKSAKSAKSEVESLAPVAASTSTRELSPLSSGTGTEQGGGGDTKEKRTNTSGIKSDSSLSTVVAVSSKRRVRAFLLVQIIWGGFHFLYT